MIKSSNQEHSKNLLFLNCPWLFDVIKIDIDDSWNGFHIKIIPFFNHACAFWCYICPNTVPEQLLTCVSCPISCLHPCSSSHQLTACNNSVKRSMRKQMRKYKVWSWLTKDYSLMWACNFAGLGEGLIRQKKLSF